MSERTYTKKQREQAEGFARWVCNELKDDPAALEAVAVLIARMADAKRR